MSPMTYDMSPIIADRIIHLAWQSHSPEAATPRNLSGAQWAAVRFLARSNAISRKPSGFAEFHGTTRGTASQTLKSLESAGLVYREKDERDGRSVRFSLTEAGRFATQSDPVLRLTQALNTLSESEKQTLEMLIEQVSAALSSGNSSHCLGCCHDCRHFQPATPDADSGSCGLNKRSERVDDPRALCIFFEPEPAG